MRYQQPYGVSDPNAPYINGDPSIGRRGSIPPAAAFEEPMREIINVITGAGLTPNGGTDGNAGGDLQQLWEALQIAPWIQEFAVDTGTANNYAATLAPMPPHLYSGMVVRIKIAHDNTGACTLNLLGGHSIKLASGADPIAGDLKAGEIVTLVFDGATWQISNYLGAPGSTGGSLTYTLKIPYSIAGGTANALTGTFTPTITALSAGDPFLVKATANNTGPATLQVDALTAKPIIWGDGSPLAAGTIRSGMVMFLVYDGTSFQIIYRSRPKTSFMRMQFYFTPPFQTRVNVPDPAHAHPDNAVGFMPLILELDDSTYANGVFVCGARDAGLWQFTLNMESIGLSSDFAATVFVPNQSVPSSWDYIAQDVGTASPIHGTSACVSLTARMNPGQTACFAGYWYTSPVNVLYGELSAYRLAD
jgi:hypothetical protein